MGKRASVGGSDQSAKKCKAVYRGIAAATEVPETVKELLDSGVLENSLAVPPDSRHAFQSRMITAVGTIIEGLESGMQKAVEEKEAEIKAAEEEQATQTAASEKKQTEKASKHEVTQAKKVLLANASGAFKAAKETSSAAEKAQVQGDLELDAVGVKLEALEKAVETMIKPVVEAGVEQLEGGSLSPLVKLLAEHGFNESMLTALPGAVTKAPADRGPFDTLVVQDLNEEVAKRLESLKATVAGGAKGKADRASAVAAAAATVKDTKEKLIAAAKVFETAQADEAAVDEALEAMTTAVSEAISKAKTAQKALAKAKANLTKFQKGPQLAFADLKEGKKEEEEAPEEEAAAEPAATEAAATEAPPAEVAA